MSFIQSIVLFYLLTLCSTCYESRLQQHLKVCNAKKLIDSKPVYIVEGINRGDYSKNPKHILLSLLEKSLVDSVIQKVEGAHERLSEAEELILYHEIFDGHVNNLEYGFNTKKHFIQNSSLLAHINRAGLVRENTCYIVFGAGKDHYYNCYLETRKTFILTHNAIRKTPIWKEIESADSKK